MPPHEVTSSLVQRFDYRGHRKRVERLPHLLEYWDAVSAVPPSKMLLEWSIVVRLS